MTIHPYEQAAREAALRSNKPQLYVGADGRTIYRVSKMPCRPLGTGCPNYWFWSRKEGLELA